MFVPQLSLKTIDMINLKFVLYFMMKFNLLASDVSDVLDAIQYDTRRRCCPWEQHRSGYYTQALRKEGMSYSTTPICIKDHASIICAMIGLACRSFLLEYHSIIRSSPMILQVSVSREYDIFS
jgi:hypothetical protein